jgi:hypothetical protein
MEADARHRLDFDVTSRENEFAIKKTRLTFLFCCFDHFDDGFSIESHNDESGAHRFPWNFLGQKMFNNCARLRITLASELRHTVCVLEGKRLREVFEINSSSDVLGQRVSRLVCLIFLGRGKQCFSEIFFLPLGENVTKLLAAERLFFPRRFLLRPSLLLVTVDDDKVIFLLLCASR